jgi:hypothetical protein
VTETLGNGPSRLDQHREKIVCLDPRIFSLGQIAERSWCKSVSEMRLCPIPSRKENQAGNLRRVAVGRPMRMYKCHNLPGHNYHPP